MVEKKKTSFASAKGDSDRFNLMFPGSIFAKGYQQSDSKVQYVVKYGITDHLKKQLIGDVKNTPYSLLFDETTNSQLKSNMMGVWCIGPKGLIVLAIHNVDRYLLGIALLSIWLSILRNLWSFWRNFRFQVPALFWDGWTPY